MRTHFLFTTACLLTLALLALCRVPAGAAPAPEVLPVTPSAGALQGKIFYTNSHAVLIGINSYPKLLPGEQLRFAENDATKLREVLIRSYGFPARNITLLTGSSATRGAIWNALSDLTDPERVKRQDRVLIYFSGHGKEITLEGGRPVGFLLPYDAAVSLQAPSLPEYVRTCLEMAVFRRFLDLTPARHAVLISDSCYSGGLVAEPCAGGEFQQEPTLKELCRGEPTAVALSSGPRAAGAGGGEPTLAALEGWLNGEARQILTAGVQDQKALEYEEKRHSFFTYTLLELLQERARESKTFSFSELAEEVKKAVPRLTNGLQNPIHDRLRSGTGGENILLSTAPREVPPPMAPVASPEMIRRVTVALLAVSSTPSGARIWVDGRDTGKVTPATLEIELGLAGRKTADVELRAMERPAKKEVVLLQPGRQTELVTSLPEGEAVTGQVRHTDLGGVPMAFASVPPGEFLMGSDPTELGRTWQRLGWREAALRQIRDEGPMHPVRLDAFEMGATEVTVAQFRAFCAAAGRVLPPQELWNRTDSHPVHNVSWRAAAAFCEWATQELARQKLPGLIRLPREAEWEYAARGKHNGFGGRERQTFLWGNDLPKGGIKVGNLADEAWRQKHNQQALFAVELPFLGYDDKFPDTAPVGQFPPNEYALRDLAGNLWE